MSELWAPRAMDKIGKDGCRASPCFIPGFEAKRIFPATMAIDRWRPNAAFRYCSLTGTLSIWSVSSHIVDGAVDCG